MDDDPELQLDELWEWLDMHDLEYEHEDVELEELEHLEEVEQEERLELLL